MVRSGSSNSASPRKIVVINEATRQLYKEIREFGSTYTPPSRPSSPMRSRSVAPSPTRRAIEEGRRSRPASPSKLRSAAPSPSRFPSRSRSRVAGNSSATAPTEGYLRVALSRERFHAEASVQPLSIVALGNPTVYAEVAARSPKYSGEPDYSITFGAFGRTGISLRDLRNGVEIRDGRAPVFEVDPYRKPNEFPYITIHYDLPMMNKEPHSEKIFVYEPRTADSINAQTLALEIVNHVLELYERPSVGFNLRTSIGSGATWTPSNFSIDRIHLLALHRYGDIWVPVLAHDIPK